MKRVVLVLPVLPHYRIDFVNKLSKKLANNDYELKVVAGSNIGEKLIKEIKKLNVHHVKSETIGFKLLGFEIQWQKRLFQEVLDYKPDKVVFLYHAGKINYNLLALLLTYKKIPFTIWTSGSGDNKNIRNELSNLQLKLKWLFKKFIYNKAHNFISYSNHYASKLVEMGYDRSNIFVANNTINIERIVKKQKKDKIDIKTNNKKIKHFLFVGALTPQKKLDKAIHVFNKLVNEGNLNFYFNIVGQGNEFQNLKNIIHELDLQEYVILHGAKYGEELEEIFLKNDVFLLPGTGGLAVNEAMAYGLPIISTPGDGTGYDIIEDEFNGKLLDFDYTNEQLYKTIIYMLNLDDETLKDMGINSRLTIMEKAPLSNMIDKFCKAIIN